MCTMKKPAPSIASAIDSYEPRGSWRGIDALVKRIVAVRVKGEKLAHIFRLFERFPDTDGSGVFLSLRHVVEATPGYETALVASLQRTPSEGALAIAYALVNAGTKRVGRVDLVRLLKSAERGDATPPKKSAAKSKTTSGVRAEDLATMLGKKRSSPEVAAFVKKIGAAPKVSGHDEMGGFFGCTKTGFAWTFDEKGVLDAIFVPPCYRDNERTTVTLPFGLAMEQSRKDVRKLLGKPRASTEAGKTMFAYCTDTYERGGLSVCIKYKPDASRIESMQIKKT